MQSVKEYFKNCLSADTASIFFLLSMTVIFPLYLNNRLFNVVDAKFAFFVVHTFFYVSWIGLVMIIHWVKERSLSQLITHQNFSFSQVTVLMFIVVLGISFLNSQHKKTAFWGLQARYNGLLLLICCVLAYFLVVYFFNREYLPLLLRGYLVSASIVYIVAALNHFGMDPLFVYAIIRPSDKHMYISTIGNINFFASYIALTLPIALYGFVSTQKKMNAYFYLFASFAGFWGLLTANSDSGYVAIAVTLLTISILPSFTAEKAKKLLLLNLLFWCSAYIFGILDRLNTNKAHVVRSFTKIFVNHKFSLFALVFAFFLWVTIWIMVKKIPRLGEISIHKGTRIIVALLLVILVLFLFATNGNYIQTNDAIRKVAVFDEKWGSNRGGVWGLLSKIYLFEFSWIDKFFGTGLDTIKYHLNPKYTEYLIALNGSTFDSAHNEYLHFLIGAGILGVVSYIAIIATHLHGLLDKTESPIQISLKLSILAYAVQAFFNIAMPVAYPLFFILLGVTKCQAAKANYLERFQSKNSFTKIKIITFVLLLLFLLAIIDIVITNIPQLN